MTEKTENKKKRYPADRVKLHALLEKKETDLQALTAEVEEIRALTRQADFAAINATAEMYNVTPEEFARYMQAMHDQRKQAVEPLPEGVKSAGKEADPVGHENV